MRRRYIELGTRFYPLDPYGAPADALELHERDQNRMSNNVAYVNDNCLESQSRSNPRSHTGGRVSRTVFRENDYSLSIGA